MLLSKNKTKTKKLNMTEMQTVMVMYSLCNHVVVV